MTTLTGAERTIVVVDDRADRAAALAAAIELGRCGRARVAGDARAAAALGSDADAVLLRHDVEDDSIQILRALSDAIDAGLPVLVVADNDEPAVRRRVFAAGARDFVVVPDGSYAELVLRLGNLLEVRDLQTGLERRIAELD